MDVVAVLIDYTSDLFIVDSFFDVFFDIELDTDQNPDTGAPSQISQVSQHGPTDLGVDIFIHCSLFGSLPSCDVTDQNHNPFDPNVETNFFEFRDQSGLDPRKLVLLIHKENLIAAGGPGPYNMAALSRVGAGVEGASNHDVVPNGGNVEIDPEGFDQVILDELFDTFFDFFFYGAE